MKKTTLTSGNYTLRSFDDEGIYYGADPIVEVDNYSILGVLANKTYTWDFSILGHDIIPRTLFAYKSTGVNNNDNLTITIRNASNNALIHQMELANNKIIYGNAFVFNFPFFVVSQNHTASIVSSVALDSLVVFGRTAHLNPTIPPTYAV